MTALRIKERVLACVALLSASAAPAIEHITLEAARLALPDGATARGAHATLALESSGRVHLRASVAQLRLAAGMQAGGLSVECAEFLVREPEFACHGGALQVRVPHAGALTGRLDVVADSARSELGIDLTELAFAGGTAGVTAHAAGERWSLSARAAGLRLAPLRALLPAQLLPADVEIDGSAAGQLAAQGSGRRWSAVDLGAQLGDVVMQNAAGTLASEGAGATLQAALRPDGSGAHWTLRVEETRGQVLAGPVLLDFGAQPLTLAAAGHIDADRLAVEQAAFSQPGLLAGSLTGRLRLAPAPLLEAAQVDIERLEFPAAYTSFLQLALAATELGTLRSHGTVSGHLEWRDGAPRALDAVFSGLEFDDGARQLALRGVDGHLQWDAAGGPERVSGLAWQSVEIYGIEGGAGALALRAHADEFILLQPARIPIFDGALLLRQLELAAVGTPRLRLAFAADIEPIGMEKLSTAFGWPAMSGQLAGHIPGLVYRDQTLAFEGDLRAAVFDGSVIARHLRLMDPLGSFPRLTGEFEARHLDLGLITRTFPIGSITGRIDADIRDLELFGWSPVAFDAHLYTTPGDRSRHRISQKAVDSLANLGGGGGVMGALQSGFLQFFKTFGYDRIGLTCQLRDDVCLMGGIPRREGGFYIVRGGGLPRIDVVANSGRVAWSRLVDQVLEAIQRGGVQVGDAQHDPDR
ncbi:MAG: hypothetical protein IT480_13625 [Gammaproteobacteria bacterium]|nr:hypothetical protein [Gammaproteobacteria bacterium]